MIIASWWGRLFFIVFMIVTIFSACLHGLEGKRIDVEVDVARGLPSFTIVGLGDTAVQEARERVNAALTNCGLKPPSHSGRVTVNLAPAHLRKIGSSFDVPIALGYLLATKQCRFDPSRTLFLGELSLNGRVRPAQGVLAYTMMARSQGLTSIFVPFQNAHEASLVSGIRVVPVGSLKDFLCFFSRMCSFPPFEQRPNRRTTESAADFSMIIGQERAKRALEIAAAGGHNILMSGPPGSGKTLLANAMVGILPSMTNEEILEVTNIYSVSGLLSPSTPTMTERPFRSPHHSSSAISLIGGGSIPHPGEVSLAHRGVLFLDEFPEFPGCVLEHLRQPLEDGIVHIARSQHRVTYPCAFILVASMNPCPCGFRGCEHRECVCSAAAIHRYRQKLSGPLLDRIDLHIHVPAVPYEKLAGDQPSSASTPSRAIRARVERGRAIQGARYRFSIVNARCSLSDLRRFCTLSRAQSLFLRSIAEQHRFSARGVHRILKVARTIADLDSSEHIQETHIAEAAHYRLIGSPTDP